MGTAKLESTLLLILIKYYKVNVSRVAQSV